MVKKRLYELEVFSGIAIVFVVIIHANAAYIWNNGIFQYTDISLMYNTINIDEYTKIFFASIFNLIDKIVHVAVPMFLFVSGYKYAMNNRSESYANYFMKKIRLIFKPFLAISLSFLILTLLKSLLNDKIDVNNAIFYFIKESTKMIIGYNFAYQLWYVPMYLFVILTYPIIIIVFSKLKLRFAFFCGLAILWVGLESTLPIIKEYPYPISFIYYFYLYELGIIYYRKSWQFSKRIIYLYIILLIVSTIISNEFNLVFTEMIFTPVAVIALFYIAKKLRNIKFLQTLGKYSFYIFLFHEPIILGRLFSFIKGLDINNYFILVPLITTLTIVLSIVLTIAISKVPILNSLMNLDKFKYKKN